MTARSNATRLCGLLLAGLLGLGVPAARAGSPVPGDPSPSELARSIEAGRAAWQGSERLLHGFSLEGTSVTAWREHGTLRKVEVTALGERGRIVAEFYWRGGRLVSARERRIDYGRAITEIPTDQPLPMTLAEDHVIDYREGRAWRWWRDGQPVSPGSAAARERALDLSRLADSMRRLSNLPQPARACEWQCAADWDGGRCARFACR